MNLDHHLRKLAATAVALLAFAATLLVSYIAFMAYLDPQLAAQAVMLLSLCK